MLFLEQLQPFWNQSTAAYYNNYNYDQPFSYGYDNTPHISDYSYDEDPTRRTYAKRDIYESFYPEDERAIFDETSQNKRQLPTYIDARPQETLEETGSQRVQVNNGFQEDFLPGFNSESGHLTSGILLQWKLTFFGTGKTELLNDEDS